MNTVLLAPGATKLVEVNGRVEPGERVLIVTDYSMVAFAEAVAAAASARGAEVVTCVIEPRKRHGEEPPAPVAAAMREANVIYTPVSVSITHTRAMRAALDAGARAIAMTAYTVDLMRSAALLMTDFEAQADVCRRLGDAFTRGSALRLASPRGTDLRFSIAGRRANVMTNIPGPGELSPVPDIEVNVVPVTGTAEGTLIIDASIPYLRIGVLDEPVVCAVEEGFIVRIEGGRAARMLDESLRSYGDRNCYNVAELGVGLNPNARLTGEMLEDEGVMGTIHVGIGTSHMLGGEVVAPTHFDLLMWDPTIDVDGEVVQQGREILV
ncbi:MAG: leucyl aminopeptidase [Gemmatimonadetes bacterium]|nr:leucyl aminopeptidase [Gemmatimonadota bacterium]